LEDCFADVNGVRLHYMKAGAGPLMIFLHGFPEFWYAWRMQLPEFAKDHLVVAPDMRGYNLSGKPAEVDQYAMPILIEDVRALAEHLGYKKFVLVGHDWGGSVSWAFAIKYPEYLEKLVIANAPHPGVFGKLLQENAAQQQASQYIATVRAPGAEAVLSANNFAFLKIAMARAGLRDGLFSAEDWKQYEEAWSQPGALTGALNYYRAMRPANVASNVNVAVSTLVLWGELDTALVRQNVEGLHEFVPNLAVRLFPAGSHWIIHEHPQEVSQAIREFLAVQ
jgi:pimeloyl-ACP methyl ester carboxylesterase